MPVHDALTTPLAKQIVEVLLHFLWQGALVALLSMGLQQVLRGRTSAQYAAAVGCFALMAICPLLTFAVVVNDGSDSQITAVAFDRPHHFESEDHNLFSQPGEPADTALSLAPAIDSNSFSPESCLYLLFDIALQIFGGMYGFTLSPPKR